MLERILPSEVSVSETRGDILDVPLLAEEEDEVARAVEKRRREFTTARTCARRALERLGVPPQSIPSGPKGEPQWPLGVVGSITHCDRYRACAVARSTDLLTLGVDAEPNEPLPDGLLADIALPAERAWLQGATMTAPGVCWDRLLFSAKESVYKAWFPLVGRWLGFEDAIVTFERPGDGFSARLLVPVRLNDGIELTGFSGRWIVSEGLVLTAIAPPIS